MTVEPSDANRDDNKKASHDRQWAGKANLFASTATSEKDRANFVSVDITCVFS